MKRFKVPRLTQASVKSLAVPPPWRQKNAPAHFFFDGTIPGFGVRVHRGGYKEFVLDYRLFGQDYTFRINSHDECTVQRARKIAERALIGVILYDHKPNHRYINAELNYERRLAKVAKENEQRKKERKCLQNAKHLLMVTKRLLKDPTEEHHRQAKISLEMAKRDAWLLHETESKPHPISQTT